MQARRGEGETREMTLVESVNDAVRFDLCPNRYFSSPQGLLWRLSQTRAHLVKMSLLVVYFVPRYPSSPAFAHYAFLIFFSSPLILDWIA